MTEEGFDIVVFLFQLWFFLPGVVAILFWYYLVSFVVSLVTPDEELSPPPTPTKVTPKKTVTKDKKPTQTRRKRSAAVISTYSDEYKLPELTFDD